MLVRTSVNSRFSFPLISRTWSPGSRPAFQAGVSGATPPTRVPTKETPKEKARRKRRKPKIRFIAAPATSTNARWDGVFDAYSSSAPVFSSSISSPAIFTYPPKGRRPMTYSVSPRRIANRRAFQPKMVGWNPRAKVSTRIPTFFAARKCPSSWTKIRKPIPRIARKTFRISNV